MLTEDYLIRRINQALALLLHAIGLRKDGQIDAALTDVDIALELLIGMRSHLIREMSDASILQMLTAQGVLDLERLALVADLFKEEGQLYLAKGHELPARQDFARALSFSLEAALADMDHLQAELVASIAELTRWMAGQPLPMELQVSRYNYVQELLSKDEALVTAAGGREPLETELDGLRNELGL